MYSCPLRLSVFSCFSLVLSPHVLFYFWATAWSPPHKNKVSHESAADQALLALACSFCIKSRPSPVLFMDIFDGDVIAKCFYARSPVCTCNASRCAHTHNAVVKIIITAHRMRVVFFFFPSFLFVRFSRASAVVSACSCSPLLLSPCWRTHARTIFSLATTSLTLPLSGAWCLRPSPMLSQAKGHTRASR